MLSIHSVTRTLVEPRQNGHQTNELDEAPQIAGKTPSYTTEIPIPVVWGPKGLRYDVGKVADEWQRNRILANRASAKISRQRRIDEARAMRDEIARLEDENKALEEANVALERRIKEAQASIEHLKSVAPTAHMHCVDESEMKSSNISTPNLSDLGGAGHHPSTP
jgi:hypothetical protein